MREQIASWFERIRWWVGLTFPRLNRWATKNWWTIKMMCLMTATVVWVGGSVFVVASTIAAEQERADRSEQNSEVLLEIQEQGEDVKAVLALALEVTGPDAESSQEDYFRRILEVADCNTANRLNQVIQGLEREGLLRPGRIVLNC